MKVAIIGPICRDEIIIGGKSHSQIGGATYYTGHALNSLDADTTVFGSCGNEGGEWLKEFGRRLIRIMAQGTIKFVNEYPVENSDIRKQKAEIYSNKINPADIGNYDMNRFDYIVLGPLFHDNISPELFPMLSKYRGKVFLGAQGMIRFLDRDKIVWKTNEEIFKALPYIDLLVCDDVELNFICGMKTVKDSIRLLRSEGIRNVVVTKGIRGSDLYLREGDFKIKSFPVTRMADPTGAGDSYLAGFIKGRELFKDPVKQGEFAAMVATVSMETRGPFGKGVDYILERLGWDKK